LNKKIPIINEKNVEFHPLLTVTVDTLVVVVVVVVDPL